MTQPSLFPCAWISSFQIARIKINTRKLLLTYCHKHRLIDFTTKTIFYFIFFKEKNYFPKPCGDLCILLQWYVQSSFVYLFICNSSGGGSPDTHPILQEKIRAIHPVCSPIAVSLWIILNLLTKSMTCGSSFFFPIPTLLWSITGWTNEKSA